MRALFFSLMTIVLVAGCGGISTDSLMQSEPASQEEALSSYYDFDDVIVPTDMNLDPDRSFVLETPTSKSGVLVFSGNIERLSLTDYFINNMARDNWTMRSAIKSNRSLLLFEKPTRYCVLSITDGRFSTEAEIWVLPKTGDAPKPELVQPAPAAVPETVINDPGLPRLDQNSPVEERPFPIKEQGLPQ